MTPIESPLPFGTSIRAHYVVIDNTKIWVFGGKIKGEGKNKDKIYIFNVFFEIGGVRLLTVGWRVAGGQIYGPQARVYRKVFDHIYCGASVRGAIYEIVKQIMPKEIHLKVGKEATVPLFLGAETFDRFAVERTDEI